MRVQVVSFRCVIKNQLGEFISSSFNQDVTTNSEEQSPSVMPGFVEALKDLKQGEKRKLCIKAEKAYGFYDPQLTLKLPRSKLLKGKQLKEGDVVLGKFRGEESPRSYRVSACSARTVSLDGNHPLAGQDLVLHLEMIESREEWETDAESASTVLFH